MPIALSLSPFRCRRGAAPAWQFSCLLAGLLATACGGGGGGGGGGPPPRANTAPSFLLPSGLTGAGSQFFYVLPRAGSGRLAFAAVDAEGDTLSWTLSMPTNDAAATGLSYQTPVSGGAFDLDLGAVAATAAGRLQLLVEDAFGGAAAIDLTVVRSGPPALNGITPGSAFVDQPQVVTLTGSGLSLAGTVTTQVSIGGIGATGVVVSDDRTLRCNTPAAGSGPGSTIVSAVHAYGGASLPASAFALFRYPPRFATTDTRLDQAAAAALDLAIDGDVLHAAFVEAGVARYRRSLDNGNTWSPALPLGGSETDGEVKIVAQGGKVLVAWIGNQNVVRAARSLDGGATFAPSQRLDAATVPEAASAGLRVCGDGDFRYVAWIEGSPQLLAARTTVAASTNAGDTWSAARRVDTGFANQAACEIACVGARAFVVQEDERTSATLRGIYASASTDGGATWHGDQRLNRFDSAGSSPRICADAFAAHVVWVRDGALYYNSTRDGGASWRSSEEQVRDTGAGAITSPDVACEGTRVYVSYVAGGTTVWVARSTDALTFPGQVVVDNGTTNAAATRVLSQGNYVFTAWQRGDVGDNSARIVHAESTNAGAAFGAVLGLGDGTAAQTAPLLLHRDARVALGWLDQRNVGVSAAYVNVTAP